MTSKSVVAIVALMLSLSPCYAKNQLNKTDPVIKDLESKLERALLKTTSPHLIASSRTIMSR
jgi:hypothetical protein